MWKTDKICHGHLSSQCQFLTDLFKNCHSEHKNVAVGDFVKGSFHDTGNVFSQGLLGQNK